MDHETIILDLSHATPAEIDRAFMNITAALTKGGPLNPETLLGNKPASLIDELHAIAHDGDEQAARECLAKSVTTSDLAAMARDLSDHYAGGDDGPIREPGDDVPHDSDVMSHAEIVAALDMHAASLAKRGVYGIATDLQLASRAFEKVDDEIEALHDTIQDLRDKLTHHGLTDCERDVGCLLYADHAGHCVTSFAERDRIRRDEDAAERGNDVE